ncbi:YggT family protein [Streptococcus suis]|uniref:YggT family protein n=1 Tax=Streptococcus suis TaxID=1307 RepID=UPI001ABE1134|nr:YggT family protein [Streptococcus suis]
MDLIIIILLKALEIYSYILLAYAFMSWIPGLYDTFIGRLVIWMVRPILLPFRNLRLQFMGLDWTIFIVMVVLNLAYRFLYYWLVVL